MLFCRTLATASWSSFDEPSAEPRKSVSDDFAFLHKRLPQSELLLARPYEAETVHSQRERERHTHRHTHTQTHTHRHTHTYTQEALSQAIMRLTSSIETRQSSVQGIISQKFSNIYIRTHTHTLSLSLSHTHSHTNTHIAPFLKSSLHSDFVQ
jgi:hypothetical protein